MANKQYPVPFTSSPGGGGGGSGTVTSVTFTGDGVSSSATPSAAVTTSGTLTATPATQSGNVVIASPANGSSGPLSARALVSADFPSLVTTAGQGFMVSYGVLAPYNFSVSAAKVTDSGTDVYAWQFVLPCAITITKCNIQVGTGVNASTITIGVYSADKSTKLLDSGTFASVSGATVLTNTIGSVTLPPGVYWFAQSASTATTLTAYTLTVGSIVNLMNDAGTGGPRAGKSNQTTTLGVMPSSLGTITGDNSVSPIFCMFLPA